MEFPLILGLSAALVPCLVLLIRNPLLALFATIIYTFILPVVGRETMVPFQFGVITELLLLLTWIGALVNPKAADWQASANDLVLLTTIWFVISVLQIFNPAGASVMGWLSEIRTTALTMVLTVPLACALIRKEKHADIFLYLTIGWAVIAAVNGIKQLYIGLFPGEEAFLMANTKTHLIRGVLRVFSFYTDAAMFGASMAQVALISWVLALGPFTKWKRIMLFLISALLFYAMMISGTRGAFFVFAGGVAGLFLTKNFRLLLIGLFGLVLLFSFLKFTNIGQGNYQVRRLRTAVNPTEDASFLVRMNTQMMLRDYLADKPFGGGLGTIGNNGKEHNPGTFLAGLEPDSYWVKVWAMYGITGLVVWFCLMCYILGKCCRIVWRTEDPKLKIKLVALVSATTGVFIASYGNEVINRTPASILAFISLAIIYNSRKWDTGTKQQKEVEHAI